MPTLKSRMIFISHAWRYDSDYHTLVRWFDAEPNFDWRNCSVPSHDALPDKTTTGLEAGITRQISPAQVVLILAGMYAVHSGWIEYEVKEAQRMQKTIIAVRPRGQEKMPVFIQEASICEPVGWNSASVVAAIRAHV